MNSHADDVEDPVKRAAERLDGAMARVERMATRLAARAAAAEAAADGSVDLDADRAKLAQSLDAARGREAALEAAAQEASDALDRAIADLRSHITEE